MLGVRLRVPHVGHSGQAEVAAVVDPLGATDRTRRAPRVVLAHPPALWAAEAADVRVGARARGGTHVQQLKALRAAQHVGQRRAHLTRRAGAVGQRRVAPPRVAFQQRRAEIAPAAGVPTPPDEVALGHAPHDDARAAGGLGGAPQVASDAAQRGPIVL